MTRWTTRASTAPRLGAFLVGVLSVAGTAGPAPADAAVAVLHRASPWRVWYSWARPMVQTDQGPQPRIMKPFREARDPDVANFDFMTQYPPPGWTGPEFDDSAWGRRHFFLRYWNGEVDGRARSGSPSRFLGQFSLRGRFKVTDPEKVKDLTLTLEYRGGAAVYINGKPLARGHLPEGALKGGELAEAYSDGVTFKEPGKAWSWYTDKDAFAEKGEPLRVRRLEKVRVPAEMLRRGVNLLAIEIHTAPYAGGLGEPRTRPTWSPCGLVDVALTAAGKEGLEPNVMRPAGVQVWTANTCEVVHDIDWADPLESPAPLKLIAPRNGFVTGRAVVSADKPLKGVQAAISDLAGPDGAKIPAAAVRVSYGTFEPRGSIYSDLYGVLHDDGMDDQAPKLVDVSKAHVPAPFAAGAVQPVYVTLRAPADAAPGVYKGSLTIRLDGDPPPAVPVELTVADWKVPDPTDFAYWCGLIQSPEGVAAHYGVGLWSDRHWELMGTSFDLIRQLGPRVLYIPVTAQTEFGNAEGLVRFVKGPNGKLAPDLSVVEKYVDLAVKRMGRVEYVLLGVWQWCEERQPDEQGAPLVTVIDPKTNEVATARGPKHGTAEAAEFWTPVLEGIRKILDRHTLADALVLGNGDDQLPNPETVAMFAKILPKAGWYANRHKSDASLVNPTLKVPMTYQSNVYGSGEVPAPAVVRHHGWKKDYPVDGGIHLWLERSVYDSHCLALFRRLPESMLMSGRRGQGQIGADFWPPSEKSNRLGTLFGRYLRTANVGAGGTGLTTTKLLHPGANGALPTLRFEVMRENIQETEARIFLEKLLTAKPCPLPAELAERAQAVLDERARWSRLADPLFDVAWAWPSSGWEDRTARLYQAAAEAARTVAAKP